MKLCKKCNAVKDYSDFSKASTSEDGLFWSCKECTSAHHKAWYQKNKAKKNAANKAWYGKNSERVNKASAEWAKENRERKTIAARKWREENAESYGIWDRAYYMENKEKRFSLKLSRVYGITLDQYKAMLAAQDGKCALGHDIGPGSNICVDHDHATGRVRGLLCTKHNAAIGMLGDSHDGVRAALEYLERHEKVVA